MRICEIIRYRDRVDGEVIRVNPRRAEFQANFRGEAPGILTRRGDFVVAYESERRSHPDILHLVGIPLTQDQYHLDIHKNAIHVVFWYNFDDVPGEITDTFPQNLARHRAFVKTALEKYSRYTQAFRNQTGLAVKKSPRVRTAWGGEPKVLVVINSPDFADGPLYRERF